MEAFCCISAVACLLKVDQLSRARLWAGTGQHDGTFWTWRYVARRNLNLYELGQVLGMWVPGCQYGCDDARTRTLCLQDGAE